ncbi:hypothetical protein [Agromyces aerolatus]|uniref:hypothetical protein n=1 Tax=Agromyces sp. LY-1074 TaxID=3074080 RepID=UPI002855424A|nr:MULTISPECIES: hypothetical protein [unclassified Agromyces]MDR5699676.1 hypothetical protein [Agromyces sp. LY-1074]MDR5705972.1 hypothetical protein [Agromyces sp. LY-1358]
MYVSESHFPWLQREHEARITRELEQRRVIAERLAEERDAASGWTETAGRRGIRQLLPARLLHRARPAM